jgi:hypothetical protein
MLGRDADKKVRVITIIVAKDGRSIVHNCSLVLWFTWMFNNYPDSCYDRKHLQLDIFSLTAYIGALNCTSNTVCLTYFNNSRCINPPGVCQCESGYYQSTNNLTCVRYFLGSTCSASALPDGCSIAIRSSSCISDRCQCMTGYRDDTTACTPRKYSK